MIQQEEHMARNVGEASEGNDVASEVLNTSLEVLLVSGGDSRMRDTLSGGLNKYGCAPRVREAIAMGSCTASSLSPEGLIGARHALDRLRYAARVAGEEGVIEESEQLLEAFRQELARILKLDKVEHDIVFCPSGTDAEIVALELARAGRSTPFLNIVTGPSEVGSGTIDAAGGRHFDPMVPSGKTREKGDPIDPQAVEKLRVESVTLRRKDGELFEPEELDHKVDNLVSTALDEGIEVLLHVVTHSKTGVYAPTFEKAAELRKRSQGRLTIVLDAAQGRLSRDSVGKALALDYLVLMTGSKFYGGPPFSGMLLVPEGFRPQTGGFEAFSPGMSDYLTAPEIPIGWKGVRAGLPTPPNVGLVLRWAAAVAEMTTYYQIHSNARRSVMAAWEKSVPELLDISTHIEVVPVAPPREQTSTRYLEAATTVFPFFVCNQHGRRLRKDELKRICRLLNRDLSGALPRLETAQKAILAREIHIGQPVSLGGNEQDSQAVLRVALGAPMVRRITSDDWVGGAFEERSDWLNSQLSMLRAKLELIMEYNEELPDV